MGDGNKSEGERAQQIDEIIYNMENFKYNLYNHSVWMYDIIIEQYMILFCLI